MTGGASVPPLPPPVAALGDAEAARESGVREGASTKVAGGGDIGATVKPALLVLPLKGAGVLRVRGATRDLPRCQWHWRLQHWQQRRALGHQAASALPPLSRHAESPSAVQAVKQHVSETRAIDINAREAAEQLQGDRVRASADFEEGVAAFREKRSPNYG